MDQDALKLPRKRFFRQRAHSNVLGDHFLDYPIRPSDMDWSTHFPAYFSPESSIGKDGKQVEFADIGCGYGGLMVDMAKLYPGSLMIGMEIRVQVTDYVHKRILALRAQAQQASTSQEGEIQDVKPDYQNISVMRMNAMKFLPNHFHKHQLSKMFFLFPDPHFKKKKHKARIITKQLLGEYCYCLKPGGILYTCTDVKDLHEWMVAKCDAFPLLERLSEEECSLDPVVPLVMQSTEEGKKVARNQGDKYLAVYRRLPDPELPPLE